MAKVIICGAPGAGKGTQCEELRKLGLVHISTGDILRAEVQSGSELGRRCKALMDAGSLVPDDLVNNIVAKRLAQSDCQTRGWILDGFPRTVSQAQALAAMNVKPDLFLLLDVPADILVDRIVGRRIDPVTGKIYHLKTDPPPPGLEVTHRPDDKEETVRPRFEAYARQVDAIREFYKNNTVVVDGTQPRDVVTRNVLRAVRDAAARAGNPLPDAVTGPTGVSALTSTTSATGLFTKPSASATSASGSKTTTTSSSSSTSSSGASKPSCGTGASCPISLQNSGLLVSLGLLGALALYALWNRRHTHADVAVRPVETVRVVETVRTVPVKVVSTQPVVVTTNTAHTVNTANAVNAANAAHTAKTTVVKQ